MLVITRGYITTSSSWRLHYIQHQVAPVRMQCTPHRGHRCLMVAPCGMSWMYHEKHEKHGKTETCSIRKQWIKQFLYYSISSCLVFVGLSRSWITQLQSPMTKYWLVEPERMISQQRFWTVATIEERLYSMISFYDLYIQRHSTTIFIKNQGQFGGFHK